MLFFFVNDFDFHFLVDFTQGEAEHHHDDAKDKRNDAADDDENFCNIKRMGDEQNAKDDAEDTAKDIKATVVKPFDTENNEKHKCTHYDGPQAHDKKESYYSLLRPKDRYNA